MALITCPECGAKISDKAKSCIQCGCPMEIILSELSQNEINSSDKSKTHETQAEDDRIINDFSVTDIKGQIMKWQKGYLTITDYNGLEIFSSPLEYINIVGYARSNSQNNGFVKLSENNMNPITFLFNTEEDSILVFDLLKDRLTDAAIGYSVNHYAKKDSNQNKTIDALETFRRGKGGSTGTVIPPKKKKKTGCLIAVMLFVFMGACVSCFSDDSDNSASKNTQNSVAETQKQTSKKEETEAPVTTETEIETKTETEVPTIDLYSYLDKDIADKAYDILKEQIGFTDPVLLKKMGSSENYEMTSDNLDFVVTAGDDIYRVFIPNSGITFYEDDSVKTTLAEVKERTIDHNDLNSYYIIAQDLVSQGLVNPGSADFPSLVMNGDQIGIQRKGNIVAMSGYVDAKNRMNATVRSNWVVEFEVYDLSAFQYDLIYLEIDGESVGTFQSLD